MKRRRKSLIHNPFDKVKGRMTELGISQMELSKQLYMSVSTLNEKINGKADFSFSQLGKIAEILDIKDSELNDYFFKYALRNRK